MYDEGVSTCEVPTLRQRRAFEFEDRVHALAGVLNRAHAQLVEVVEDALTDETWGGAGISSPEHWLILHAGLSRSRAASIVALARRRAELPVSMAAFDQGALSLEQSVTIARHVPAEYEASVTELAVHATVPQIQRAVSRHPFPKVEPSPQTPQPQPDPGSEPPSLSMRYDGLGGFALRYTTTADEGALIEQSLRQAKDALFASTGAAMGYAQAFTSILSNDLATAIKDIPSRRELYRVLVHLDIEGAWLNAGPRLPRHVSQALTCDAALAPVWRQDGTPVRLGRTRRSVPPRVRALITDRDRGCRFPGCPATGRAHVEVHHLQHWLDGGATDPDNLACLCQRHHHRLHAGDFQVSGNPELPDHSPDGLRFTTAHGLPIRAAPPDPATTAPAGPRYAGPSGETLYERWVEFAPTG